MSLPQSLFVDDLNQEVYVADAAGVLVYSLNADGDVAPVRTLDVGDGGALDMFLDRTTNELFVVSLSRSVKVYPRTATGRAAVKREVIGSLSGFFDFDRFAICN
jgi:hypothetical protein